MPTHPSRHYPVTEPSPSDARSSSALHGPSTSSGWWGGGELLRRLLTLPLELVPDRAHSTVLAAALNHALHQYLRDGELDHLYGRSFCIAVTDLPVAFRVALGGDGFSAAGSAAPCDLTLCASSLDFLALATRRQDADTLFFQRRLRLEGDTALGLAVKNLLDGLEPERIAVPTPVRHALAHLLGLHDVLFGRRSGA